ncbi:MAG: O-antigen ligase family protein [Candidatus Riflebacteria bacterium]|nr:O-antigen ligase family protein [Candidatus Riflebacteria bacterium]
MAKLRKQRKLAADAGDAYYENPNDLGHIYSVLINVLLFLLLAGVILVVPFLYSRYTTENFLTPKEFTGKIWVALLSSIFFIYILVRHFFGGKTEFFKTSLDFPVFLFFAFCAFSLAWNYNIPSAIRDLRGTFLIMLLFPLIINIVWYRWQFETVLWIMAFTGIATATLGIMESYNIYFRYDPVSGFKFARDEIFSGRIYDTFYLPLFPQLASKSYDMQSIVSTFGNRNYLGTYTMFTAFIPIAFYFYYRNLFMKFLSMGLFGWMIFGMYISRCRAALLGLACGFVFMFIALLIFDKGWKFVRKNSVFFLAGLMIALSIFLFSIMTTKKASVSLFDKLKTTFTMDRQASNVFERVWVWYGTAELFIHSPIKWIIGNGYGSFKHMFPLQEAASFDDDNKETFAAVTFRQTHNDWLQLVAELGLIGLGLFIFLCWRFFGTIYHSIWEDMKSSTNLEITGEHVLLVALGAAMVSQLVAAIPDFPFHRIETALYAVVLLALVPLYAENSFFKRRLSSTPVNETFFMSLFAGLAILTGFNAAAFELKCWDADKLVRKAESLLTARATAQTVEEAKNTLKSAIYQDPLPGDPYLKLSSIYEMEGKIEESMKYSELAWQNINFNARSTYHSVVFRQMHIAYHLMRDHLKALQYAMKGQYLTAGEARSIYYFYIGKIALEAKELTIAEWALRRSLKYPSFASQAASNLAVCLATMQRWPESYNYAASLSASLGDQDPMLLDIIGISGANLGKYEESEIALKKAVELNPGQTIYRRDLGWTQLRMNRISDAKKTLEDAMTIQSAPENIKAEVTGLLASISAGILNQGKILQSQDKKSEAAGYYKIVIDSKYTTEQDRAAALKAYSQLVPTPAETVQPQNATQSSPQAPVNGAVMPSGNAESNVASGSAGQSSDQMKEQSVAPDLKTASQEALISSPTESKQ